MAIAVPTDLPSSAVTKQGSVASFHLAFLAVCSAALHGSPSGSFDFLGEYDVGRGAIHIVIPSPPDIGVDRVDRKKAGFPVRHVTQGDGPVVGPRWPIVAVDFPPSGFFVASIADIRFATSSGAVSGA